MKYLGNSELSTGSRVSKKVRIKGTEEMSYVLLTWSIRQCTKCGRFLPKGHTYDVCQRCSTIKEHERHRRWNLTHPHH